MEGRKRETTLEVLKRLQSQNKAKYSVTENPPVIRSIKDILGFEEEPRSKLKAVKDSPNSEGILLLNKIKEIEKKLKNGSNYFDHYYDLRKSEDKLLRFCSSVESKESLPEEITSKAREIERRLKKIK